MERLTDIKGFEEIEEATRHGERYLNVDIDYFAKMYKKLYELENDMERISKASGEIASVEETIEALPKDKILLVEDGSVDVDRLEGDGFYVIVYRQGANKPEWLDKG